LAFASSKSWQLLPGAISLLTALKFLGLKVCVLSNTDSRMRQVLGEMGLLKFFDQVFLSLMKLENVNLKLKFSNTSHHH
jgi:FMN phosphatase YigB (HAD superfamily)